MAEANNIILVRTRTLTRIHNVWIYVHNQAEALINTIVQFILYPYINSQYLICSNITTIQSFNKGFSPK